MTKQFEDHIKKHKDSFDTLEPRHNLWDRINKELDEQDDEEGHRHMTPLPQGTTPTANKAGQVRQLKFRVWQVAAGLFFVLSAALVAERFYTTPPTLHEMLGAEYAEVDGHYMRVIQTKQAEIARLPAEDPYLIEDLVADIEELNVLYNDLQQDYLQAPNERLVNAMIDNLKLRIAILDKQLEILEKVNHQNNEDNTRTI